MTSIIDNLTYADGRPVNGRVIVSWPAFQVGGLMVAGGQTVYPIVGGVLSVLIAPNVNAIPVGTYYTALYELEEGAVYNEYWMVPDLATASLGQVRVNFPITPSVMINAMQLTSAGASYGQFLGWNGTRWVPMYLSAINVSPNTIGLALSAAAGADLSVTGSPAPLGSSVALNVPDAGAASRGVVSIGAQTLAGAKTFTGVATFSAGIQVSGSSLIAGYVPVTRQVFADYGLQGGGPLSGDVHLSVADNASVQKVRVTLNSALKGTRHGLNFVQGANVTLIITDNSAQDWVDVVIAASGGGGGGATLPSGSATGDTLVWQAVPGPGFWTVLPMGPAGQVLTAGASGLAWAWPQPQGVNTGDLLAWQSGAWQVLARGQAGQVLTAGANATSWANIPAQVAAGATTGDMLIWTGSWTVLPLGAANRVLTVSGGSATWVAPSPWKASVDGGGFNLTNVASIAVSLAAAQYPIDVAGDINCSGTFRVKGTPLTQSPWLTNIDGNGKTLQNAGSIGVGFATAPLSTLHVKGNGILVGAAYQDGDTGDYSLLLQTNPAAGNYLTIGLNRMGADVTFLTQAAGVFVVGSSASGAAPWLAIKSSGAGVGFVGIGGAAPGYQLDVVGDINASGAVRVKGVALVTSVFGRGGAVAAQAGDYTASQVTYAVSTQGSYSDPAWLDISWGKVSGKPATFPPSVHVHSGADITTGTIAAARLGGGSPSSANYLRGDGQWATVAAGGFTTQTNQTSNRNITGTVYTNGGGKALLVTVSCQCNANAQVFAYADASGATTVVAVSGGENSINESCLTFVVLPSYSYKVTTAGGTATLSYWYEWS